ncbi:MAG: CoA pyrophosphatase [Zoogloeaceae bacterium]|jgi:8-oxo-dGTP pyrophosphatase MutT (NUDIX family)|nr:CoA pyrophosphatase [Zoogloeaceae bacterium]
MSADFDLERLQACLAPEPVAATDADDFADKAATMALTEATLTPSAVLFPIVLRETGAQVLLTRRTDHLRDHPGQISFPGGRMEAEDKTPVHAALREAEEEIGLARSLPRILGYLPTYRTATGFLIYPVVALLTPPFELRLDAFEVAEAFEAPLSMLFDPTRHRRESIFYRGARHEYHVIDCETDDKARRIWGATAGMILSLYRRVA